MPNYRSATAACTIFPGFVAELKITQVHAIIPEYLPLTYIIMSAILQATLEQHMLHQTTARHTLTGTDGSSAITRQASPVVSVTSSMAHRQLLDECVPLAGQLLQVAARGASAAGHLRLQKLQPTVDGRGREKGRVRDCGVTYRGQEWFMYRD